MVRSLLKNELQQYKWKCNWSYINTNLPFDLDFGTLGFAIPTTYSSNKIPPPTFVFDELLSAFSWLVLILFDLGRLNWILSLSGSNDFSSGSRFRSFSSAKKLNAAAEFCFLLWKGHFRSISGQLPVKKWHFPIRQLHIRQIIFFEFRRIFDMFRNFIFAFTIITSLISRIFSRIISRIIPFGRWSSLLIPLIEFWFFERLIVKVIQALRKRCPI